MSKINFFTNTKYENEYKKAILAKNNVSSASSNLLLNDVNNIKSSVSRINLSSIWNDSGSAFFESNRNKCLTKLDNIINSINSYFKKSEELYLVLFEQLEILKETESIYHITYDSKPQKSDYQETITNPINNMSYTRTKDSYYTDHQKWENSIKELENSCKKIQTAVDEYITLLKQINGMSLQSSTIPIDIPNVIVPEISLIDFVDYTKIVDKELIDENYKFDVVVEFDGHKYFAFSQGGYGSSELQKIRFAYTDGKGATTISGAACSMCSLLNGLSNMLGLAKVTESFGLDSNELNYKDGSLNSTLLVGINEKAKELGETSNKRVGIEQICEAYFKDSVEVTPTTLGTIGESTLKEIHEGNAFLVVRLGKNSTDRYNTGGGHYIAMIDYDEQTKKGLFIDSAVKIDENDSTFNSLKSGTQSRTRINWGSLYTSDNTQQDPSLVKVLNGGLNESYDPNQNIDKYNLIIISKK